MTDSTERHDRLVVGTYHAPAERATTNEIETLAARALSDPLLHIVFDAIGGYAMVLDEHRQLIVANDELLSLLGIDAASSIIGLRPGEVLKCVNACRGPNGCGTSVQCRHCGAVAAILSAQTTGKPIDGKCTISRWVKDLPQLVDFRVRVSPLKLGDSNVYIAIFQNISELKWAELQQRMFLHDMANVLMGLNGWSELLARETTTEAAASIVDLVRQLSDSLNSQRLLMQCEMGEFRLQPQQIHLDSLKENLQDLFTPIASEKSCRIVVRLEPGTSNLVTDLSLLLRVLGNLIKNAFEATQSSTTVTVTVEPSDEQTVFTVHNVGAMPTDTAERLFKRRFSTKGRSRGLGIYAVQVFGEQYLGGHVEFESSEEYGTLFRFTLPNAPSSTTLGRVS